MGALSTTAIETVRECADAARYAVSLARPSRARPRADKRILVLTRGLPPNFHGGSFRQLALLQALHRAGWLVDVVTDAASPHPNSAGIALLDELPDPGQVFRWQASDRRASYRFAPRLSGGFSSIRQILEVASGRPVPSIVLASGPPFAEFVAAALVARRYRIPCVFDYRDEWTTSGFAFVERGPGDGHWERLCLAAASAVVFATDAMRLHYLSTFPVLAGRLTATIRNGWDDTGAFGQTTAAAGPDGTRPAVIGFFGYLGEHWDFPEFARTLSTSIAGDPALANRIRIALYGKVSADALSVIESMGPRSPFQVQGLLPHREAQLAMGACDGLLLFNGPRLARVLPGKLYEYIAARRPILLYGESGEMGSLLGDVPGTTIVRTGDATALRSALHGLLDGTAAAQISTAAADYADQYQRRHRDQEWIGLLETLRAP